MNDDYPGKNKTKVDDADKGQKRNSNGQICPESVKDSQKSLGGDCVYWRLKQAVKSVLLEH